MLIPLTLLACTDPPGDTAGAGPPVLFALPLTQRERFGVVVGVDHDPEVHDDSALGGAICTDYAGRHFPYCYDEHDGTDFLLDGDFTAMDADPAPIVAAAAGVVESIEDGNYDKCHIEGSAVSCDGHPMVANHVIVDHGDGVRTLYWHMRKDSVAVAVGDEVACGDLLGEVGSSGNSSKPHLHFEVQVDGDVLDPFAGSESQDTSWWREQSAEDGLPADGC